MTRVALFGGSFNPPHVAHQLVALYVLETQPIDEVWFIPVYQHVFGKQLADFEHRVAMCELAVASLGKRVSVIRVEEELSRLPNWQGSRTFDLISYLQLSQPDLELRLLVGTDILAESHKWYRWDDVVAAAPLIVVGRPGNPLPPGSTATELVMPDVSSTLVRDLLAQGDPKKAEVAALLPASVLGYIAQNQLYR